MLDYFIAVTIVSTLSQDTTIIVFLYFVFCKEK